MVKAFDRYGQALGFWTLPAEQKEDDPIELKLQMGDGKKLRNIMMDSRNKKDKNFMFQRFEVFMFDLIKRDYSDVDENAIKGYIEMNIMVLFENAQITFRFTTEADLARAKKDAVTDLKKSIEGA